MPKSRKLLTATLVIMALIFCYAVVHLFLLRFERGDIYAPYSSLRSDPLGTRALFEGLAQLDALSVQRNHRPLTEFRAGGDTTYFYLGVQSKNWQFVDPDLLESFEKLAVMGARLVFSFSPVAKPPNASDASDATAPETDPGTPDPKFTGHDENKSDVRQGPDNGAAGPDSASEKNKDRQPRERIASGCTCHPLRDRWGVSFGYQPLEETISGEAVSVLGRRDAMQFPPVAWRTLLFFENLQSPWKTIYTMDGRPVIIQRAMGRGSIVFTADSFFLSNEGLQNNRNPDLLAWLIGPNCQVVFDEFHFGIAKTKGIAVLIRTYRLHWFFLGIAVLAVLLAWKNSTHFIPPPIPARGHYESPPGADRDYTHGLISLLRRNITAKDILTVCVAEWKKTAVRGQIRCPAKITKIEALIHLQKARSNREHDPVVGYQTICSILAEGKNHDQQPGNP